MSKTVKDNLMKFLNHFETYVGAVIFLAMTVFLTIQVITRYVFRYALVWTEELSTILFVWMVYLGISAAITSRKHIRIDALLDVLPFKWKKVFLIASNIVLMAFCLFIIFPMITIIQNMAGSDARTLLLHISMPLAYSVMPFSMMLTSIRIVQDCVRLGKENQENLGASKPTLDLGEDAQKKEGE